MRFFCPFLSKMVYHRGFFVQCCIYVCTNIYTQTDIRVCLLKKVHPPPTAGQKTSKHARRPRRCQEVRLFSFNQFCFCSCALWGQKSPPTPKTCAEVNPPPPVMRLVKDGRSSLRVEKKREVMSCVKTEI